jgi:uncharacterized iron-regulated membrane protein
VRRLRSFFFYSHLAAGCAAGLVILVMSATGAALAMKPQILNVVERRVRFVAPQATPRLAPSALLAAAKAARPETAPVTIAIDRDPSAAAAVGFGPNTATLYVDPYTGLMLGEGSTSAQVFFRTIENWHRWLGADTPLRPVARWLTDASNVVFLGLALTGLFLWWPHAWTPQHTRAILFFRRGVRGRARDFNWHNAIGFWCAPVIVIMTASGVVMSYPWANALLYRMTNSPLPAAPGGRAGAPGGAGQRPRDAAGERRAEPSAPLDLDRLWAVAEAQLPTWRVISLRIPDRAGAPAAFTLTDGASWNAFARSQLTLDAATAAIRQWQPYDAQSLGQRARGWVRFGHTGELGRWPGQLAAGLACVGGVFLVWTGLSLAIRRFRVWLSGANPGRRARRAVA